MRVKYSFHQKISRYLDDIVIFCSISFSQVPLLARKARPKEQAAFGSNASQKHPRRFQCGQDSQQIVVDISLEFDGEKTINVINFVLSTPWFFNQLRGSIGPPHGKQEGSPLD